MTKKPSLLREEILELPSRMDVIHFVDNHEDDFNELDASCSLHINLLTIRDYCDDPKRFHDAMYTLRWES